MKNAVLTILLFCLVCSTTKIVAQGPDTLILIATKDALLSESHANDNFGSFSGIAAGTTPSGVRTRSVLSFDLSQLPETAEITGAQLDMDLHSSVGYGFNDCYLERITEFWLEGTVTWNNQPAATPENRVTIAVPKVPSSFFQIDVTQLVIDMQNSYSRGFLLKLISEFSGKTASLTFQSRENYHPIYSLDPKPKLTIIYDIVETDGIWERRNGEVVSMIEGNVGIKIDSVPSNYKMAINGSVKAKKVKVSPEGWSDHVFEDAYTLMTLSDLKKFIQANSRLPGIPSAEEAKSKGMDQGYIMAKYLEKIEELTLYLIDQRKRLNVVEEKINRIQSAKNQ